MHKKGLFIGLLTLDFLYLTPTYPAPNQKLVAEDYTVAAGGPATNAAVTFSALGYQATLLSVAGQHSITQLIKSDLITHRVDLIDLDQHRLESPPVSSIIVTKNTGDRSVISINATKSQISNITAQLNLAEFAVILIDGHQINVSENIANLATNLAIPLVLDGGSWKPGLEKILPQINYAICSANFYPPGCQTRTDVLNYLKMMNISHIAITQGAGPIIYSSQGENGTINISEIKPIDTLGAGDIFHGAFCYYILQNDFPTALSKAAKVATYACQFFGTRQWLQNINIF